MTKQEYQKKYREEHREELRAYFRERYHSDLHSKIIQQQREYYHSNRDVILERQKEYSRKNRDRILRRMAKYQQDHPEVWRRNVANYVKRHPDRVRDSKKKWQDAHKIENLMRAKARRAKMRKAAIDMSAVTQFFAWIRNQDFVTCTYCGSYITGNSVHIDHIVPISRGGAHDPNNFAVSCNHCNHSKSDFLLSEWPTCPERFKSIIVN